MAKLRPAAFMRTTCSRGDMAEVLDLAPDNVTRLAQKGVIARSGGKYNALKANHDYINHLREQAAGRATSTGNNLADERAETEKIKRQIEEIKLKQLRDEVLTVDEVSEDWSLLSSMFKTAVLAIPGKVRGELPHLSGSDEGRIRDIIRQILLDLADDADVKVIGAKGDDLRVE